MNKSSITIQTQNFSLHQICNSGQCFRMKQVSDDTFEIIARDRCLLAEQHGVQVIFHCSQEEYNGFWEEYFDLKTDYASFIERINPNDTYLTAAAACGSGVRILKQDLWEMIVTFLISQQNNIKRIKYCIEQISEKYGREMISEDGKHYHAFPEPEAFLGLEEDALMACNLGYRSKYVVRIAKQVAYGELNLEPIQSMTYPRTRQALLQIFGVGGKVADCICLFALHQLQAFPVDTHIRQVLDEHYKRGFPNRRYADCKGVMQQYIFYYELTFPQSNI